MSAEDIEDSTPSEDPKIVPDEGESERAATATRERNFFSDERGNLKVVNLVVRHPCKVLWSILLMCIALSFLLNTLVFSNGNPFTEGENEFDLDDIRSIQYDSFRLAVDEVQKAMDLNDKESSVAQPIQSDATDSTYWVYEATTSDGVFGSADSIEAMKEAFDLFFDDEDFGDWCRLDYRTPLAENATRSCSIPTSPLTMYYASQWDSEKVDIIIEQLKDQDMLDLFNSLAQCYSLNLYCEQVPNTTNEADVQWALALNSNISSVVQYFDMKGDLVENYTQVTELASYLMQVEIYKQFVDFGYDKSFGIDNQKSMFSRGFVLWGGPLASESTNLTADELAALESDEDTRRKNFVLDNYLAEMDRQADTSTHQTVNSYYYMGALIGDVILQIVIQDALLALFSLAFVFFWLRVNTGSWFLSMIGFLEIVFSIPISWFIFSVIFRIQYFATLNALAIFIVAAIGADDIFLFMDAYKQSKMRYPENLVDLETRMSWVYRRTGTAMAITSATTCMAFLCTLITPLASIQSFGIFAAIVIFIDYLLVMSFFCTAVVIYHDRYEDRSCCGCCFPCDVISPSNTDKAREALEQAEEEEIEGDIVSRFFRNQVAGFVKMPVSRAAIFAAAAIWLGVAIWQAMKIEATKEAEQFLAEDNPLQKSVTILNQEFPTATDDEGLKVYYAWGLGEVDRTGVNLLLDPEFFGEPTFEYSFDFNTQCQTELLKFCDKLKTDSEYKTLIKQNNGVGEVFCFVEELAAYSVRGNLEDCDYVRTGGWRDEKWQVDPSNLTTVLDGFTKATSCYDTDGTKSIREQYKQELGWDGLSIKYAAVSAESAILDPFSSLPESVTRAEYDQFIAIGEEMQKSDIAQSCGVNLIVTDLDNKFVFMNNQAIYVTSAVQSSALGVGLAFAVLLISTRVLHIAFFASLCICSVLVSVVGVMVMLGWELGSTESILIGIIAGFSVDYVVHLAHAYKIADGDTYERITEAFADLGISVFNGMITSVAASIPLFFCQLQFFAKFGTFLCLTIAFSWLFANFAFMSLLATLKIPIKKGGLSL